MTDTNIIDLDIAGLAGHVHATGVTKIRRENFYS